VTAQRSTWRNGAVVLFRDRREPGELTDDGQPAFLGVRPNARSAIIIRSRSRAGRFYSFAAHFARIGRKGTGISAPISGRRK